jgi:hypothetical protein
MWCVADLDEDYIAKMEDVLETYEQPYDPQKLRARAATVVGRDSRHARALRIWTDELPHHFL